MVIDGAYLSIWFFEKGIQQMPDRRAQFSEISFASNQNKSIKLNKSLTCKVGAHAKGFKWTRICPHSHKNENTKFIRIDVQTYIVIYLKSHKHHTNFDHCNLLQTKILRARISLILSSGRAKRMAKVFLFFVAKNSKLL